jgi:hypothetical protein
MSFDIRFLLESNQNPAATPLGAGNPGRPYGLLKR